MLRFALSVSIALVITVVVEAADKAPNIVILLCDDLGDGDQGW